MDSAASRSRPTGKVGGYRWRICALLFAITSINYVDRQVLGVLAPFLQGHLGWNEIDYGYIVTGFQAGYAVGLLFAGALIDRVGTRVGYALAIGLWSLAAMGHALVASVLGFVVARFMLGLGEAGNFPAAVKTVAEWFPRRERSLATGLFNSGSNLGAIIAPVLAPAIVVLWGWRAAFVVTGLLSGIWLVIWWMVYRKPEQQARLSSAELAHIRSDPPQPAVRVPWSHVVRHRQAWAFIAAKFFTDPIWWFFLFWLPKFLHTTYGLSLLGLGPPLIAIFLAADVGSVGGGWLAGHLIRRGWSVNRARKSAMFACAMCVVPIMFAAHARHLWLAVALIGLATAGHQGWSANVFTLSSDLFPRRAVASVVGIGSFAGAVGGMLISTLVGLMLQSTESYVPVFVMAGSAYLVALLVVHLLVPRLRPVSADIHPDRSSAA